MKFHDIPSSYVVQDGCHNCVHSFMKIEYDDIIRYYCTFNSRRPKRCGSVLMRESFFDKKLSKRSQYRSCDRWNEWEDKHNVEAFGKCNNHKIKVKSNQLPRH